MQCKFAHNQGRTILCAVCMLLCVALSFAALPGVLIYSYGGINCLAPTVALRMHSSQPLVPFDSCLTAVTVACLSSAC